MKIILEHHTAVRQSTIHCILPYKAEGPPYKAEGPPHLLLYTLFAQAGLAATEVAIYVIENSMSAKVMGT